ncbi:MAG: hypothetical protein KIT73_01290 [Burkholderiales bacterium]|nr:hypothetical protein [Burkholderiales bacterium]
MASQVEIANRALQKLGSWRIASLSDDTKLGRTVNVAWATVRDAELRGKNWSFAMTRANLGALTEVPAFGYGNQFLLPPECLRVVQVGEDWVTPTLSYYRSSSDRDWMIEGRKILTDRPAPLPVRYVQRVEDTQQWDATFVEAFASKLAHEICEDVTGSSSKQESARLQYQDAIRVAIRANAIELPPQGLPDNSWVTGRL